MTPFILSAILACQPRTTNISVGPDHQDKPEDSDTNNDTPTETPTDAKSYWEDVAQPLIANKCGECHLGDSFGVIQLQKAGNEFTQAETDANYEAFYNLISLDDPLSSRLLAKAENIGSAYKATHVASDVFSEDDKEKILRWIRIRKGRKLPGLRIDVRTWLHCLHRSTQHTLGYRKRTDHHG